MTDPLAGLREALDQEYGDRPRIAALATVDADGRPRVRNVVCRRIEGGMIWVASDARSAKNRQVRDSPAVELAFWLPGRREQFRVAGTVALLAAVELPAAWAGLSDAARALFAWPSPGASRVADRGMFAEGVDAGVPAPESFEVLVVTPDSVERLELRPHPHRRRRWRAEAGWAVEELNP